MGTFLAERWADVLFRSYQHLSLVIQAVALATVIAIGIALLVTVVPRLAPIANAI